MQNIHIKYYSGPVTKTWSKNQEKVDILIDPKIPLESPEGIEITLNNLTPSIQTATWHATLTMPINRSNSENPRNVKEKIAEKFRLQNIWQWTRAAADKKNRRTRDLKKLVQILINQSGHSRYFT